MTIRKPVLILSGPTSAGKTSLSIRLGQELLLQNIFLEVVNFDSLLFYRELSIGTARPGKNQMAGIPHHLVGEVSIAEEFNAANFVLRAKQTIAQIHARGNLPALVGGSGFYLRALVKGMWEMKKTNTDVRQWIRQQYRQKGIDPLLDILKKGDPASLQAIHPNDHYRLGRACEYFLETGDAISTKRNTPKEDTYDLSRHPHHDILFLHLHLEIDKEIHLQRIRQRAQHMLDSGLLEEIRQLLKSGFTGRERPLQSIGYKEGLEYLQGNIKDRDELLEKIVISTRQLAKAQRTFFKKISPKHTFQENERKHILPLVLKTFYRQESREAS